MAKPFFEQLGYGKFEEKPSLYGYSLFRAKEGWVVAKVSSKDALELVYGPAPRILALEQFKHCVARQVLETSRG
jgi:hypothetical protein